MLRLSLTLAFFAINCLFIGSYSFKVMLNVKTTRFNDDLFIIS